MCTLTTISGFKPNDLSLSQDGIYCQVFKWFQNHAHLEKKSLGEVIPKRKEMGKTTATTEEDEEGMKLHVSELMKEAKKKSGYHFATTIYDVPLSCRKVVEIPSSSRAE